MSAIYDQVLGDMRQTTVVAVVVGVVLAILAWLQGRWRGAVVARRFVGGVNRSIREASVARGLALASFGRWMDQQRVLIRVALCAVAVVWLWLIRPLSVGDILLVAVIALLAWWICEVLRRPAPVAEPAISGRDAGRSEPA